MSFFSTPLSGLNASSAALQSVSNNLANLNTNGYKSQDVSFSDVFYQTSGVNGNGEPLQTGSGVQVSATVRNLGDGPVSSTGIDSNMALEGNGYFVTKQDNGQMGYTRAGDFTQNPQGQLSTLGGQLVMGYPVVNGAVNTLAALQPLNVSTAISSPATATTSFQVTANVDATAAVGTTVSSPPMGVYDSLGTAHMLTVQYTKTGSNQWSYDVSLPSSDIQGGTGTTTSVASGSLTFDANGAITSPTSVPSISIGPLADGAATLKPTWTLVDSSGNSLLTQTATSSTTSASYQNGNAAGTLKSFAVQTDGTIEATFTNGQNRAVGQVAVANFSNPEGLQMNGNNTYVETTGSGAAVIGTAGSGGRGVIVGGSVEQSNVDVATEFAKMIVAQRSYEANAKSITAFDQVEQATIAMKN